MMTWGPEHYKGKCRFVLKLQTTYRLTVETVPKYPSEGPDARTTNSPDFRSRVGYGGSARMLWRVRGGGGGGGKVHLCLN